jgi:hypothetical protein
MHFEGTFNVKAPKEKVFSIIMDPNQISKCMPELQKLEVKSPEDFTATLKIGVSFIRGDFVLHFLTVEKTAPTHAKLTGHGTGIGSTIDMDIFIDLSDATEGGTSMKWAAEARIGGRIASVGQRLINGQAEKIIQQLFSCLKTNLEAA